tara:strand:+ start:159 stop:542 length:384 start_codon:yes stop_codon:yes gene_type:complete
MKPIKVQETLSLESVPSWALQRVKGEAMQKLQKACCELEHLVRQHSGEASIDPVALVFHIDQTRRRLYEVDFLLQDLQAISEGYVEHTAEPPSTSVEEATSLEKAVTQIKEMTSNEPEAKPTKRKSK